MFKSLSFFFPNFGQGPFSKTAGKSPEFDGLLIVLTIFFLLTERVRGDNQRHCEEEKGKCNLNVCLFPLTESLLLWFGLAFFSTIFQVISHGSVII